MSEPQERAVDRLTEIQRRGLQAAGVLVERLVASVDGAVAAATPTGDPDGDADGRRPPDPVDELVAGWAKLWRDSLNGLAAGLPVVAREARLDVDAPAGPVTVSVRLDREGRATVEVWVHNASAEPYDKLRVHCGPPTAHDGAALDALDITVDPDVFDLPARSSRGLLLSVDAPDALPGRYRTIVLVDGLPEQWLVLQVEVPEPEG